MPLDIKALAESWFKPRLEDCREAFPRAVQRKLAEFSARGMATSPPAYGAVENLAHQEVDRCGQIFLTGYKEAFTADSDPISPATLEQVKGGLDALLSSESVRVLRRSSTSATCVNHLRLRMRLNCALGRSRSSSQNLIYLLRS